MPGLRTPALGDAVHRTFYTLYESMMAHKIHLSGCRPFLWIQLLLSHPHLNKGYLRSMAMTKILIFLHQWNPVHPLAFSSPLMRTHYLRLLRPQKHGVILNFVSHTEILAFSNLVWPSKYFPVQYLTTSTTAALVQPELLLPSELLWETQGRPPPSALMGL